MHSMSTLFRSCDLAGSGAVVADTAPAAAAEDDAPPLNSAVAEGSGPPKSAVAEGSGPLLPVPSVCGSTRSHVEANRAVQHS